MAGLGIFVTGHFLELQDGLAHVLAVEDADKALGGVVNAVGLVEEDLEGAFLDPLLHTLLVLLGVDGTHVGVGNDEAAHGDALDEHVLDVLDGVGGGVVLRDHTANNHTAEVVHGVESSLEVLAADVLVVDVDTLGGEAGESFGRLLLLVVETTIKAKLLEDVVELLVRANGTDDPETLVLGELADELADGTAGSGDEDGLTLLGLANGIQRRVGSQTGHAQRTKEHTDILNAQRVLELANALQVLLVERNVLLDGDVANDEVALLERVGVGADDLGNAGALNGLVQFKGRSIRLGLGGAHAATHVGVEAGVEGLENDAIAGSGNVGVIGGVLNGEVLTRNGVPLGDFLEDERFVGHDVKMIEV